MTAGPAAGAGDAGLERLNRLPREEAERQLLACCGSRRWAADVAGGRPYPTRPALLEAAERAWWALAEQDWTQAFAAHPRIGQPEGATARREQQHVTTAPAGTLEALADGNRTYERRFGHVFLVFASGRSAGELLQLLQQRLHNDPETELRVAAGEQARITHLRLERLLG
jgi:OHCU decarboxylase